MSGTKGIACGDDETWHVQIFKGYSLYDLKIFLKENPKIEIMKMDYLSDNRENQPDKCFIFYKRKHIKRKRADQQLDYDLPNMVQKLNTKQEFNAKLADAGEKLVVVYFSKAPSETWKNIALLFSQLCITNTDVVFTNVDVDTNHETAIACRVKNNPVVFTPTFQFYKKEKICFDMESRDMVRIKDMLEEKVFTLQI